MKNESGKFNLIRYSLGSSFIVFLIITTLATIIYSRAARVNMIEENENYAISIADHLNHTLYHELTFPLLALGSDMTLLDENKQIEVDRTIKRNISSFNIKKIKIYDIHRKIIYSTDPEVIGIIDYKNAKLNLALRGNTVSELEMRQEGPDILGEKSQTGEMETYVPIRMIDDPTPPGDVIGVFEIYQSLAGVQARILNLQYKIVFTSIISMGLLLLILFFIVRKADKIVDLKTKLLREARNEIESYSRTLEQKVADRTRELRENNRVIIEIKNRNEQVLKNLTDGVIAVDEEGIVTIINRTAEKYMGIKTKDIIGRNLKELSGEAAGRFGNILSGILKNGITHHKKEINIGGEFFEVSSTRILNGFMVTGALIVFSDITQRKLLLEEISRKEKLAMLGTAFTIISHEIKHRINFLRGFMQLLPQILSRPAQLEEGAIRALEEVDKLVVFTDNLLEVTVSRKPYLVPADIGKVIDSTLELMEGRLMKHEIDLIKDYKDYVPEIYLDIEQIERTLMNIFENAIQSMVALKDENPKLSTDNRKPTLKVGVSLSGSLVKIEITDNGGGILENDISHVFDPFFTTRKTGNGLGLAISKRVIDDHSGKIEVMSPGGEGTTFLIYLPTGVQASLG